MERNRFSELAQGVSIGLVAIALTSCVPAGTEAYYIPLTDQIVYIGDAQQDPQNVAHEGEHKSRASAYPTGRIGWGIRYTLDEQFRCDEEVQANIAAGITPIDNHQACDALK